MWLNPVLKVWYSQILGQRFRIDRRHLAGSLTQSDNPDANGEEEPMRALQLLVASCGCVYMTYAQSAAELVSACKLISVMKTNERVTMLPRDFDSGLCWGVFGALEQFVKTSDQAKRPLQPASGICVPESVARSRLIGAFRDFLKTHPERNQEQFYPVSKDALKAAFPCQARLVRGRHQ